VPTAFLLKGVIDCLEVAFSHDIVVAVRRFHKQIIY
jgi:hypothetical protein